MGVGVAPEQPTSSSAAKVAMTRSPRGGVTKSCIVMPLSPTRGHRRVDTGPVGLLGVRVPARMPISLYEPDQI